MFRAESLYCASCTHTHTHRGQVWKWRQPALSVGQSVGQSVDGGSVGQSLDHLSSNGALEDTTDCPTLPPCPAPAAPITLYSQYHWQQNPAPTLTTPQPHPRTHTLPLTTDQPTHKPAVFKLTDAL